MTIVQALMQDKTCLDYMRANNLMRKIDRPGNKHFDDPEVLGGEWNEVEGGIELSVTNPPDDLFDPGGDRIAGFIAFRGTKQHLTYRVLVGAKVARHIGTYCTLQDAKTALLNAAGIVLEG